MAEEKKRGRGRPKSFETSEDFKAAIESYVHECEKMGIFPDEAGMRLSLGCCRRVFDRMISETENPDGYLICRDALEWAKDKRESFLVRKMTSDNKAAQGCLNALKQPVNGGYIDRPIDSGKIELNIKVDGVGGMDMFK